MTDKSRDFIDDLLGDVRHADLAVPDDLMARVLADAAAQMPAAPRTRFWHDLNEMIGGLPAWGGLVAAGVTGLWIGIAPPAVVANYTSADVVSVGLFAEDVWIDG